MMCGSFITTGVETVSHNAAILKKVILRRGTVPHVTQIARAIFPPSETATGHSHVDMWEIFICEEGEGEIIINDKKIMLSPGSWVLVEPNDIHEIKNRLNGQLVILVIGIE